MSVEGIVVRRSIRVTFASVDVCVCYVPDQQEPRFSYETSHHVIVLLQLHSKPLTEDDNNRRSCISEPKMVRGYLQEILTLGNYVRFQHGSFQSSLEQGSQPPRYIVPLYDSHISMASHRVLHMDRIQLITSNFIDRNTCQSLLRRYYPRYHYPKEQQSVVQSLLLPSTNDNQEAFCCNTHSFNNNLPSSAHGGKKGEKANIVVDFVLQIILMAISVKRGDPKSISLHHDPIGDIPREMLGIDKSWHHRLHPSFSKAPITENPHYNAVIEYLNSGTGVMDVCGGSGHVSMALALRGIRSTVIDPRENVGKLPLKDKKILRKAIKQHSKLQQSKDSPHNYDHTVTPMEFSSLRAWFLSKPLGVDETFRMSGSPCEEEYNHASDAMICSMCSQDNLLPHCSFIIGLHPDEATGDIVKFAVEHRIPFLIIPCCVFSRLFPTRWKPVQSSTLQEESTEKYMDSLHTPTVLPVSALEPRREIVSTYHDLIEYLLDMDESIRICPLGFDGANLGLWSYFDKII